MQCSRLIANVNGDLRDKGSNFQDCVSHLLPFDPVEKKLSKLGTKRSYDALVSATSLEGRNSVTGVDLRRNSENCLRIRNMN